MTKTAHVLIVEDDQWLAEEYVRILQDGGYQAEYVMHALAAIDLIDIHTPDVIILDVFLAGPNAFTLLHELQSHADLAGIPVILCTTSASDIAGEDVVAYGIQQVLDKTTMHPADMIAAIKKIVG